MQHTFGALTRNFRFIRLRKFRGQQPAGPIYLSIFWYSGHHIWSFSEVSVLEILRKKNRGFWLSHLNECPELLCGLSCDHRWSQTIPMRNSPWEKRILQGITISLGPTILWVVKWFYLAIFKAVYRSHSQSKNGLYFPNFMYFSTYFPNFHKIFAQIWRKR